MEKNHVGSQYVCSFEQYVLGIYVTAANRKKEKSCALLSLVTKKGKKATMFPRLTLQSVKKWLTFPAPAQLYSHHKY
jgi:hypothetical protein